MTNDRLAKRNVVALIFAQAILGAQLAMIFVIGGLAGESLAENICFATLPISMIVFGSMTTAPWLSRFMQRFGRISGLFIGSLGGALGAALSAYGMLEGSFTYLLIGSYLTGIYMSAQGFFRFAAIDMASPAYRPKAISFVLGGGLIGAVIGPQLGKAAMDWLVVPFAGTYVAAIGLNLIGSLAFFFLKIPKIADEGLDAAKPRGYGRLLRDKTILVAMICAMVSYSLMNLVMTSTPIAVVACGFTTAHAGDIVMWHVLAMFAPSFFTGHLINRFGIVPIITLGMMILCVAGVVAVVGVELSNFFVALIFLGLGWNFGFIGATTLLATAHSPAERGRVQGMNDFFVFGLVTLASLLSGGLMNCSAGDPVSGWYNVNYAMVPFLLLAFGALYWLKRAPSGP